MGDRERLGGPSRSGAVQQSHWMGVGGVPSSEGGAMQQSHSRKGVGGGGRWLGVMTSERCSGGRVGGKVLLGVEFACAILVMRRVGGDRWVTSAERFVISAR